jgi:enoyl-CoA hydratase/carnithine racemase
MTTQETRMTPTTDTPCLLRETDARGVATLTLNRPQALNALSDEMLAALQRELDAIAHDDRVRAVVIAGVGKAFCAGHSLHEMRADPSQARAEELFARCTRVMLALQRLPVPVIARVHAVATAAGCQLVAMCDLAVAADSARFAVSGVNLGIFCSTPSVALSRNVGRKQAMEMLLTGDFISAEEARTRGLVNRVVPLERLDDEVQALLARILAKPRSAIAMGKALFYEQVETGVEQAYALAGQAMACNLMDPAALEGIQAFIDKRAPDWPAEAGIPPAGATVR